MLKRHKLSSSGELKARRGDPVITGISGDYWVARSSRAMTDGGAAGLLWSSPGGVIPAERAMARESRDPRGQIPDRACGPSG